MEQKSAEMDFSFTPQQEALQKEFYDFFKEELKNAPEGWESQFGYIDSDEGWAFHRSMARKLGAKGWLSLPWPQKYGGQEHGPIEQCIFNEVVGYLRAPGICLWGLGMLAPTLLEFGTDEQKKEHLGPIAKGEIMWCQAWSEPNAGSDLASLTTRAVEDGDDYLITGQKTWVTAAHCADWCMILARTDPDAPRHRGLSYFLADMKSPGIEVRPVPLMSGIHHFNEVFLDELRVPKRNMVGEKNRGWYVTLSTMNFERTSVGSVAGARRNFDDLVQFCLETIVGGGALASNRLVRHRLAERKIEIDVGRALSYRIAWMQTKGVMVPHYASAAKVFASELGQRLVYTGCQIMGLYGQIKPGSRWAPLYGRFESEYQTCLGMNIGGGTSEIQRNIIARWGLDLPRI